MTEPGVNPFGGEVEEDACLVLRGSFECRSTKLAEVVAEGNLLGRVKKVSLFVTRERSEKADKNISDITKHMASAWCDLTELDKSDPNATWRALRQEVVAMFKTADGKQLFIDISCFRREELLFFLRLLWHYKKTYVQDKWMFTYASSGMTEWISGIPENARSVLGYSGSIDPANKVALVIMAGVENARAFGIARLYEPSVLKLGYSKQHVHDETGKFHKEQWQDLAKQLGIPESDWFEFDATDFANSARFLHDLVSGMKGCNVVVAPLNTKISTIGAGLYALVSRDIQICYAPVAYREDQYGEATKKWIHIKVPDLWKEADNLASRLSLSVQGQ